MNPILAAFNPRTADREPVEFGAAAARITGAPLIVVAIRAGGDKAGLDESSLSRLRMDLQHRGIAADVQLRDSATVGGGLTEALEELDPQMVVLGATHRGSVGSALLGTTIERAIHVATCPVAVVPKGHAPSADGMREIGAAFAPTPEGRTALHAAAALARHAGARLRAVLVLDDAHVEDQAPGMMAEQHRDDDPAINRRARFRRREEAELDAAIAEIADGIEVKADVLVNDPAEGLLAAARQLDLLVVGSRGFGPRKAVVLGSVSRKVAERAPCPVLVLPRAAETATEALIESATSS
jgi:nucleotide-binding universal stress UspA family protein